MYTPTKLKLESLNELHQFIDDFSFGSIISSSTSNKTDPSLTASHLPFLLNREEGEMGTLYCHFAKANPQWRTLENESVLAIFNGPHAYISPSWYAAKPAVPTWNYASVHINGVVTFLDDEETLDVINQTIETYEPALLNRKLEDKVNQEDQIIPDHYRDRLLKGIVAVKIIITNIEGKNKLGQQRTAADQKGVVAGLQASSSADASALLTYMRKNDIGLGN
jgi:transcriptional regulator